MLRPSPHCVSKTRSMSAIATQAARHRQVTWRYYQRILKKRCWSHD